MIVTMESETRRLRRWSTVWFCLRIAVAVAFLTAIFGLHAISNGA